MEEEMQHFGRSVLYYVKKGKNAAGLQSRGVSSVWRRCCDGSRMSEAACKVSCWRFSPDDAPRSGGPAEADSDQIENHRRSTTREPAHTLTIAKYVKLLVTMKHVPFISWEKRQGLCGQPTKWPYHDPPGCTHTCTQQIFK